MNNKNQGVEFQRDDYADKVADWNLVNTICQGERVVKARGSEYLPQPNSADRSLKNMERFKQYVTRAVFYNATGHTLKGFIGSVFRKAPELQVPTALDFVSVDVDGCGVSVHQQAQQSLAQVLKTGRHFLLVDYPADVGEASKADLESGRIRATIVTRNAESIINWQTARFGAEHRLSLVVIKEVAEVLNEDGFSIEQVDQYRVLKLEADENGFNQYKVEIWQKPDQDLHNTADWSIINFYYPTDGEGNPWDIIPGVFIGSENNDPGIDPIPLLDLATLNVAHYRNSADYEDSVYYVGQAQPFITGLDTEWRDYLENNDTYAGSRNVIALPVGATYGYAQAQANGLVKEAMEQKEKQMSALGARLLDKGTAIKTATQAQQENESEHSVLSLAATNVSDAYTQALEWMGRFMNVSGEFAYTLNKEFIEFKLDPQMLSGLIAALQAGTLPEADFWTQLRQAGIIDPDKSDKEIREELFVAKEEQSNDSEVDVEDEGSEGDESEDEDEINE